MSEMITVKLRSGDISVPEGKPVIVTWKSKNKQRPGKTVGVGWLKRGDSHAQLKLVQQTFATWDAAEQEYASQWNIYKSSILDIRLLTAAKR